MKNKIVVKATTLEESLKVFSKIKEFERKEAGTVEFCENKLRNLDKLILSAYINNENVGYLIEYEKEESFHCWVAAVTPEYRRLGILTQMMKVFEDYARKNNYKRLTLKTLNDKREMLNYLVKNDWNFIQVKNKENILKNEIVVEKKL